MPKLYSPVSASLRTGKVSHCVEVVGGLNHTNPLSLKGRKWELSPTPTTDPFVSGSGAWGLFTLVSSSAWWRYLHTSENCLTAKLINIREGTAGGARIFSELTVVVSLL